MSENILFERLEKIEERRYKLRELIADNEPLDDLVEKLENFSKFILTRCYSIENVDDLFRADMGSFLHIRRQMRSIIKLLPKKCFKDINFMNGDDELIATIRGILLFRWHEDRSVHGYGIITEHDRELHYLPIKKIRDVERDPEILLLLPEEIFQFAYSLHYAFAMPLFFRYILNNREKLEYL